MKEKLENILDTLYDYEYIDIEKFYNDKYNSELLEAFDKGETGAIQDLYEALDEFIQFETNYNSDIGSF